MAGSTRYVGAARLRGTRLHAAIWTVSCFAVAIFAYNQASAGNVLDLPSFYNQFPQMNTITTTGARQKYNANIQGTVIALFTLLGTFGALGCTFLGDVLGRRWTVWLSCLVQAIGCILMGTSFSFAQFIVSRIILGLGTGGIIATVSVWQSETAKASSRGSHVSSFGIFCGSGLVVVMWLEFGCSFIGNSASWRFPLTFPVLFSVIVMCTIFLLPESPRWLVKMGHVEDAAEVLGMVHNTSRDDEEVQKEVREIELSMDLNGKVSLLAMFKMGPQRTFHRVCLAGLIQIFLQLTGTNAVIIYSTTLFRVQLGFSAEISYILAACLQFTLIIGPLICSYTVDRYGRRPLLIISGILTSISFACLTGLTSNPDNKMALKAGAFFVYFFETTYCIGFLGIPFLYASEVAPVHLRAAVCGVSTAISWLFNFLVAEITPIAFTNISYRYFILYMCTNATAAVVVFFFYPETAGRSLEEIDEIFRASKSIFDTVGVAKRLPKQRLATFFEQEVNKDDPGFKGAVDRVENAPETKSSDGEYGGRQIAESEKSD